MICFIRKAIIFILGTLLLMVLADQLLKYLLLHQRSGIYYQLQQKISNKNAELCILGSSRAQGHYNPAAFAAHGISAINYGVMRTDVLFSYAMFQAIIEHNHRVKTIIVDVHPDELEDEMEPEDLRLFYPAYYHVKGLPALLKAFNPREQLKLWIPLYMYNNLVPHLIKGFIEQPTIKDEVTYFKPFNHASVPPEYTILPKGQTTGEEKLNILLSMKHICQQNGIRMVICISPFYGETTASASWAAIHAFAKSEAIPILDYSIDSSFSKDPSLFLDFYHLNAKGADKFSKQLVKDMMTRKLL